MRFDDTEILSSTLAGFLLDPWEVDKRLDDLDETAMEELRHYVDDCANGIEFALKVTAWLRTREGQGF